MTHPKNDALVQTNEKIPAAQYLRMSTEHQQYSSDNQATAILAYAEVKGFQIVATYSDEGKSGVTVGDRSGLLQLIDDVESGRSGFAAILVYDVSRWGRFQNPDDAAVYEVRCRWAGVPVHYVAEPFDNDGGVLSSLMKTLKRAMAAEYSRELSVKVTEGHVRMLQRGYHQGGFPCFGLQRVMIDADGQRKQILRFGERKNLQSDRVILEPGPPEHVEIVNEVYRRYLGGEQQMSLVSALNQRGDFQSSGRPWTEGAMRRMLTSECYIGNIVWGKQAGKLGRSRRKVARSNWIRQEAAFPYVVEPSLFWRVQDEMVRRKSRYTEGEILTGLRKLLKKYGTLNKPIIDKADGVPSTTAIARCFGSLTAAYEKVGFQSVPNNKSTKTNARVAAIAGMIGKAFAKELGQARVEHMGPVCRLEQDSASVIILLARYIDRMSSVERWYVHWDRLDQAAFAVIGLMDPLNTKVSAYYVVPGPDMAKLQQRKNRDDGRCLRKFSQPNLTACVSHVANHMNLQGQAAGQNEPSISTKTM
ncbi:MAG: recombinase family protein [Sphingorhabdus sp.]|uniref:recombinase family protein n=1 Tax=Sphingorhabdus sp. TaxID=1902408 RepID=UPI0025CB87D6|nr:recombinase family protein [Sphingorhabdus sp.]MCO4092876.1 recombinase family protein [Sphingorhabdus sp.]